MSKLTPADGVWGDQFGKSISISGDVIVVGAWLADGPAGSNYGSAYVYRRDPVLGTWSQEQELASSDGMPFDDFGSSVSVSGDAIVVGAVIHDTAAGIDAGAAYAFRYDPVLSMWIEEQQLTASDAAAEDHFGGAVALDGEVAVVGAISNTALQPESGAAYVFRRDPIAGTWAQEQKLAASDGGGGDIFGVSVSVSGDVIIVGARWDDDLGTNSGSAYIFRRDAITGVWVEEQKLLAADGEPMDVFGTSVSSSGEFAIVGMMQDDDLGTDAGAAYCFRYDAALGSWIETQKLTASDGSFGEFFGSSVAVQEDDLVVGAFVDDDLGAGSGSAYLFRFDATLGSWVQTRKLLASDGAPHDRFGGASALDGTTAVVAASQDDDPDPEMGSVHTFELDCLEFVRGDDNGDGVIDIADPVYGLAYLFGGGPSDCLDAQDTNDDGRVDVADPVYGIGHLISMGPAPPPPFAACGYDRTFDGFGCALAPPCP